ncbi:hypothetical protein TrVE_jg8905 [Triparma verrucosa]|uniref:Uncharacterized protein n=1 Tax=Triparma verrucosa TaxID=1606542 RepID=A0A9W7BKJ1_9STRA|nr:hypothetical protein TrVE_jg8905 [Triparma verrucosa]
MSADLQTDLQKGDEVLLVDLEGVRAKYNGEPGVIISDPGVDGGGGELRCLVELKKVQDKVLNLKIENVRRGTEEAAEG